MFRRGGGGGEEKKRLLKWRRKRDLDTERERAAAGIEGGKSSGPSREEETVWQKLYNTNRKTVFVWKQRMLEGI